MNKIFSERNSYKNDPKMGAEEMPDHLRNRLWNTIKDYINNHPKRDKVIEMIWDGFYKEDKDKLKGTESYI